MSNEQPTMVEGTSRAPAKLGKELGDIAEYKLMLYGSMVLVDEGDLCTGWLIVYHE